MLAGCAAAPRLTSAWAGGQRRRLGSQTLLSGTRDGASSHLSQMLFDPRLEAVSEIRGNVPLKEHDNEIGGPLRRSPTPLAGGPGPVRPPLCLCGQSHHQLLRVLVGTEGMTPPGQVKCAANPDCVFLLVVIVIWSLRHCPEPPCPKLSTPNGTPYLCAAQGQGQKGCEGLLCLLLGALAPAQGCWREDRRLLRSRFSIRLISSVPSHDQKTKEEQKLEGCK